MTVRVLEVMARSAGGVGRHVAALVSALNDDAVDIEVAAPAGTVIAMPKPTLRLEIPRRPGPRMLPARRALRALVMDGGFDVIHAHGSRAAMLSVNAAAGRPVVVTLHNLVRPEISGRLRSVLYRRGEITIVRKAAHVFAVSSEMAASLRGRVTDHAGKVEELPIGLAEPSALRSAEEVRRELDALGRPLLVTIARLVRQKALDVMLAALGKVDDAVLVILGDGYLADDLRKVATDMGVSDRVRFLGWQEEVGDYLHAADVFVLSSTWEARALAAQEAILARTPVVSTDVGGMPELITDRESGRLVPPNDPEALAAAIREVLEAPETARGFAERARDALIGSYSETAMWDRIRAEYLKQARV